MRVSFDHAKEKIFPSDVWLEKLKSLQYTPPWNKKEHFKGGVETMGGGGMQYDPFSSNYKPQRLMPVC